MVTLEYDINTCVNLLVPSKVRNIHYIQEGGLLKVHSPRLGDYFQVLPLRPSQVFVSSEHNMVLVVSLG
jgi:hypothetical protein